MVGTGFAREAVLQMLIRLALHALLQLGLIVDDMVHHACVEPGEHIREDKAPRNLESAVQVHGGDDRLDGVGEDARALTSAGVRLALAEQEIVPQLQPQRNGMQALLTHELCAHAA